MARISSLITFLLLVFLATPVWGETTKLCTEPFDIKKPCAAVCLPPGAAHEGLHCLDVALPKLKLELKHFKEILEVRIKTRDLIIKELKEASKRQNALLDRALKLGVHSKPSFWERPIFWAVVGVVTGAAATIAISYVVRR